MKEIIFVCTGNYYRSRFAEAWFNFTKSDHLCDWRATSRGLMVECAPGLLSPHTLKVIREHGVPDSCFQPEPIALKLVDFELADHIIALKRDEHYAMMQEQFPEWADRIQYWDVHDLDVWRPEQTIPAIQINVGLLIAQLGRE